MPLRLIGNPPLLGCNKRPPKTPLTSRVPFLSRAANTLLHMRPVRPYFGGVAIKIKDGNLFSTVILKREERCPTQKSFTGHLQAIGLLCWR